MARAARRHFSPGDLVLHLVEDADEIERLKLRTGTVIAVDYDIIVNDHMGCEERILVLWNDPSPNIIKECECGLMSPPDLLRDE